MNDTVQHDWFDEPTRIALRDYLSVYEANYDSLLAATMPALLRHPEFGRLLAAMPEEVREANNARSRTMLRRAILDGEWRQYELDLREQGESYAKLGVTVRAWHDVVSLVQQHLLPRLVDAYSDSAPRLKAVLTATSCFMDRAMVTIAEEYLAAKERAIRAAEAENVRVEEASRAKSDFLSMMSHELRTPLNAIIGFSEMLGDGVDGPLSERQARYVANVTESGRHLLGLINDLLDLSKIEAGRLEVTHEACPPRRFALDAMSVLQPLADARQVRLVLDPASPPAVSADGTRLKQVLYNLLSNAIKFSPSGGSVHVQFEVRASDRVLRIAVSDRGPGISAPDIQRLFMPFVQLESAKAAPRDGTGLGLALTRQLVELMGGRVGVTSVVGEGSTFFVDLPLDARPAVTVAQPLAVSPGSSLALIVEDDPAAAELLDLALRQGGYRTAVVATSEAAIAYAREHRPSIITLDVFLPAIDGWDLLRILKSDARTAKIPVVMVTISSDRKMAFSLGAVEHLVKPIDRKALLEVVARHRRPTNEGEGVRVLVIDDDIRHLEMVRQELEPHGFSVRTAPSGQAGIEEARREPIDLLILDLVMPDLSGVEVVEALRREERTRALPILLLTAGQLSPEDHARLNGDVAAILAKGALDTDGLIAEIRRIIKNGA